MPGIDKDVCVIGSGFGGGVAALRFTQAGRSVVVLEKGDRWDGRAGSREFQQTQGDFKYWLSILNAYGGLDWKRNSLAAIATGRGLGGGSLVYSMVSLRAPTIAFDGGWPEAITRSALDPFYEIAENQLQVTQLAWEGNPRYGPGGDAWKMACKRDGAFAWACRRAGVSCDPAPLAIGQGCANLGWCMTGCVLRAKNSVDRMYIHPAEDRGALVKVRSTAYEIAPNAGAGKKRRWKVTYQEEGHLLPQIVEADAVVVASGAIGSPALLLRSAGNLSGGISDQTGRNLSRGGDMVLFGVLPDDLPGFLEPLETYKGKIIGSCSFHYMFNPPPGFGDDWRRFALQPMGALPILPAALLADPDGMVECRGPFGGKQEYDMRSFGAGPKHYMRKYGSRLLQVGVMGFDDMDGQVTLKGGLPWVTFDTTQGTRDMWAAARAGFKQIIEDGGGGKALAGWDDTRPNDGFSIHPLGSCRMADSHTDGALRHDCAVWRGDGAGVHEGLHVMDVSTLSRPIGVNTSLTTAAIAERACAEILGS